MFKLRHLSRPYSVVIRGTSVEFHTTVCALAGHSKWANIKHVKGLKDGQRSIQFNRLSRTIRLAVQEGGGSINPELNSPLRVAIDEALKRNMPNSTIQGVLKKCSVQTAKLKKHLLEIRHGFKVFTVVVLYTDNLNVTKFNIATVLKKQSSVYADTRHMFFDKGIIQAIGNDKLDAKNSDELEEIATEHAIESGAEEIEIIDATTKHLSFICDPDEMEKVKQKLTALGYNIEETEHVFIPNNPITLTQAEREAYDKFLDKMKAVDGVDTIYDNVNIES